MFGGFIVLHRMMGDWEWSDHPPTFTLFVHLLMMANFKASSWRGVTLGPGQMVTGRKQLIEKTGLTETQVRTALKNLHKTGEITSKTTNKFSIISITNWAKYQECHQQSSSKTPTNHQQSSSKAPHPTKKQINKDNKETNTPLTPPKGAGAGTAAPIALQGEDQFDALWELYPNQRRGSKKRARQAYKRALSQNRTSHDQMLSAIKTYRDSDAVARGYAKTFAAWINDDRFNDQPAPYLNNNARANHAANRPTSFNAQQRLNRSNQNLHAAAMAYALESDGTLA